MSRIGSVLAAFEDRLRENEACGGLESKSFLTGVAASSPTKKRFRRRRNSTNMTSSSSHQYYAINNTTNAASIGYGAGGRGGDMQQQQPNLDSPFEPFMGPSDSSSSFRPTRRRGSLGSLTTGSETSSLVWPLSPVSFIIQEEQQEDTSHSRISEDDDFVALDELGCIDPHQPRRGLSRALSWSPRRRKPPVVVGFATTTTATAAAVSAGTATSSPSPVGGASIVSSPVQKVKDRIRFIDPGNRCLTFSPTVNDTKSTCSMTSFDSDRSTLFSSETSAGNVSLDTSTGRPLLLRIPCLASPGNPLGMVYSYNSTAATSAAAAAGVESLDEGGSNHTLDNSDCQPSSLSPSLSSSRSPTRRAGGARSMRQQTWFVHKDLKRLYPAPILILEDEDDEPANPSTSATMTSNSTGGAAAVASASDAKAPALSDIIIRGDARISDGEETATSSNASSSVSSGGSMERPPLGKSSSSKLSKEMSGGRQRRMSYLDTLDETKTTTLTSPFQRVGSLRRQRSSSAVCPLSAAKISAFELNLKKAQIQARAMQRKHGQRSVPVIRSRTLLQQILQQQQQQLEQEESAKNGGSSNIGGGSTNDGSSSSINYNSLPKLQDSKKVFAGSSGSGSAPLRSHSYVLPPRRKKNPLIRVAFCEPATAAAAVVVSDEKRRLQQQQPNAFLQRRNSCADVGSLLRQRGGQAARSGLFLRELKTLQRQTAGARKIQATVRGVLLRRHRRRQQVGARRIQRAWRSRRRRIRDDDAAAEAESRRKFVAARQVQALARGCIQRNKYAATCQALSFLQQEQQQQQQQQQQVQGATQHTTATMTTTTTTTMQPEDSVVIGPALTKKPKPTDGPEEDEEEDDTQSITDEILLGMATDATASKANINNASTTKVVDRCNSTDTVGGDNDTQSMASGHLFEMSFSIHHVGAGPTPGGGVGSAAMTPKSRDTPSERFAVCRSSGARGQQQRSGSLDQSIRDMMLYFENNANNIMDDIESADGDEDKDEDDEHDDDGARTAPGSPDHQQQCFSTPRGNRSPDSDKHNNGNSTNEQQCEGFELAILISDDESIWSDMTSVAGGDRIHDASTNHDDSCEDDDFDEVSYEEVVVEDEDDDEEYEEEFVEETYHTNAIMNMMEDTSSEVLSSSCASSFYEERSILQYEDKSILDM